MEEKFILPVIILINIVFLVIFFVNNIEAHRVERAWLTGGTLLCMITALIVNLIKIL